MVKIRINGPIVNDEDRWVYNWFGIPCVSPQNVTRVLDRVERERDADVLVLINSGGGSVFAASEIYHALKSHKGKVVIEITGMAGSAASVVAMAGDDGEVAINPTGQVMIHNALMGNHGDYRSMDSASELLQNVNISIMNAYINKTGKNEEELKDMMNKETFMTAQQALEHGFVDRVLFENQLNVVANNDASGMLPNEIMKEMKNKLASGEISIGNKGADELGREVNPASLVNSTSVLTGENEEENRMDLETIKNEHPELYTQIKNEGFEEGVQAENSRIKEIEDLSMPGNEDLINGAKYDEKIDAKDLAMKIIKAEKQKGSNFIASSKKDAEEAGQVGASDGIDGIDNEGGDSKSKINNFLELYNGGAK